jgi:hypothetical protein
LKRLLASEPALLLGLVNSVIALGVGFGLDLTEEQTGALLAVVNAGIALATRQVVTSPATAEALEYQGKRVKADGVGPT